MLGALGMAWSGLYYREVCNSSGHRTRRCVRMHGLLVVSMCASEYVYVDVGTAYIIHCVRACSSLKTS